MDYQEICGHEGLEKKWQTELAMQGRDYAVAIRTARMMQKLGLVDVDLRMNDRVEFITTQYADYEETKNDFIAYNDKEAEDYCGRNFEITDFFADNPTAGYTFVKGNMIFYGKKTGKKSNTPA